MIKPGIIIWMVILMLSVFAVFQVKYRVQDLRKDLAEINRQLEEEKDAIHVLKAEWSYLNQAERLRNIAERHLKLTAVTVVQISPSVDKAIMLAANDGKPSKPLDKKADEIAEEEATTEKVAEKAVEKPTEKTVVATAPAVKEKNTGKAANQKAAAPQKMLASAKKPTQPQPNKEHVLRLPRRAQPSYPTMEPILTSATR